MLWKVYCYYSLAFLCLFSPTEITEDSVPKIVLEGASPVSFRSLIGNYFFSKDDTIWHRARMFILRAVVLPFPFLGSAMIFHYYSQHMNFPQFNILGVSNLFQPFMIWCFCCYFILAFNISFLNPRFFNERRPCFVCKLLKPRMLSCQDNLPRLITNHLCIQPLILVECWRMFIRCFVYYCKRSVLVLPSTFDVSATSFIRLFLFIIFLSTIPAGTVTILISILSVALIGILFTSPIITLCGITKIFNIYSPYRYLQLIALFVSLLVSIPAAFAAVILMSRGFFGFLIAILFVFVLLLSEKILPFLACFVLVLYYVWSSYSSFTNNRGTLGVAEHRITAKKFDKYRNTGK